MNSDDTPFWRRKSLAEMTDSEWESLCDGCGRCCLVKLEDADDPSRTYFTDVGCRLLDSKTCRCRDYPNRTAKVKDCVRLTPRNIKRIVWLPPSCAYRLLAEGRDLYWWHPLVSGDPESVHHARISVRGRVGACCRAAACVCLANRGDREDQPRGRSPLFHERRTDIAHHAFPPRQRSPQVAQSLAVAPRVSFCPERNSE